MLRLDFYDFFYKGGTNFGFMNGANVVGPLHSYSPTITSYGTCLSVCLFICLSCIHGKFNSWNCKLISEYNVNTMSSDVCMHVHKICNFSQKAIYHYYCQGACFSRLSSVSPLANVQYNICHLKDFVQPKMVELANGQQLF